MSTNADLPEGLNGHKPKSPKRGKTKPASTGTPKKKSLNLSVPHEDYQRFAVHALKMGVSISDLFVKLGREHLREFHIARSPGGRSNEPSEEN